jgi:hypothetical protein
MMVDRLFGRILWFITMISFAWTMVTMYLVIGWFSANCGIWLPGWKWMVALIIKVLCYFHGA